MCPICILTKNKVNVCDVLVKFDGDNCNVYSKNNLSDEIKHSLCFLAHVAKLNWKLKNNENGSIVETNYRYDIKRISKDIYKVCFHCEGEMISHH